MWCGGKGLALPIQCCKAGPCSGRVVYWRLEGRILVGYLRRMAYVFGWVWGLRYKESGVHGQLGYRNFGRYTFLGLRDLGVYNEYMNNAYT